MSQVIEIDNFWQGVKFCCPACGREVFTADGEPASDPCEHVLFSWIDAVGDYYNPSSEVDKLVQECEEKDGYGPSPRDDEFANSLPENAVLFALTDSGMACGPTSITVVHAIKFPINEAS